MAQGEPPAIEPVSFQLSFDGGDEQHFWNRHATRIAIDNKGIRIEFGTTEPRILRWDDPDLRFDLYDFSVPASRHSWDYYISAKVRANPYLLYHTFGHAVIVPQPVFQALRDAAKAANLVLTRER